MATGGAGRLLHSLTAKGVPRPLRKGLFDCEDKRTGAKGQKWVELYRDKFVFTKPARDSRAAFAPEAEVPLSEVVSLDVIEDGFELKTQGREYLALRGPQPQRGGELDLWFDALAGSSEAGRLGFAGAPSSAANRRPAGARRPTTDSSREAGIDDEAPGELEDMPGERPPRKLTGPSETNNGKAQNKLGLSSLTAKGVEKAICQGSFSHEIGQGAAARDRLVELYKDRVILFQQAKDQRRAFLPDILIPLSEIQDVEPTEDGFEIKHHNGEVDIFHGPADGRLDPWLENLGGLLRQQAVSRQRSRNLTSASKSVVFGTETDVKEYRPSSSGSSLSTPGGTASTVPSGGDGLLEKREDTAESEGLREPARSRVESLFDRYSALGEGEEEEEDADRFGMTENIEKRGDSVTRMQSSASQASSAKIGKTSTSGSAKSSASSKTSKTGKWPLQKKFGSIADFDDEDEGVKETGRKEGGADTPTEPINEGGPPKADGTPKAEARPVLCRSGSSFASEAREAVQRARALTGASSAGSRAPGRGAASGKKGPANRASAAGRGDAAEFQGLSDDELAEIIAQSLAAQAAGEGEPPTGLADSLAMAAQSFLGAEALSLADVSGRWRTNRGEPRRIDTNGRVSCGDDTEDYYIEQVELGDSVVLASPNGWFIDARKSVPGILLVWQKPGRAYKEWRREDAGPRLPLPRDATVRSWLSSLHDPAVVQGPLSFQSRGRLVQRFAVLFKDRLDTWDHAPCSHHGHAPEGRMHVKYLKNIQIVGKGLLVVYRARRLGIHTQSEQEAQAWCFALKAVSAAAVAEPQDIVAYAKARKSLVAGLKDGSLVKILKDLEKKGERASRCPPHSCRGHGLKQSGEVFAPPMRPVSNYPKNPW